MALWVDVIKISVFYVKHFSLSHNIRT